MAADSRNHSTSPTTNGSANACRACGTPLPKKPPSQQRKFCSPTCAGAAKQTLPTSKTCTVCRSPYTPTSRYQAARNKTCSPECAAEASGRKKRGRPAANDQRITTACATCGTEVQRSPSRAARTLATYCSRKCAGGAKTATLVANRYDPTGKPGVQRFGPDNPAWKGGVTFKRPKGNYVGPRYVRCPPGLLLMARSDGYVMEHRLVMALWIGRTLLRTECVNHINRNPRDNRRANLELYPSNGDHKRGEVGRFVEGVANQLFPEGSAQL